MGIYGRKNVFACHPEYSGTDCQTPAIDNPATLKFRTITAIESLCASHVLKPSGLIPGNTSPTEVIGIKLYKESQQIIVHYVRHRSTAYRDI